MAHTAKSDEAQNTLPSFTIKQFDVDPHRVVIGNKGGHVSGRIENICPPDAPKGFANDEERVLIGVLDSISR